MKLLRQRLDVGAIAASELTPAQVALSKAQLELGDARSQRATARVRLAESLGVSVAALDGVKLAFDFSRQPAGELTSGEARGLAPPHYSKGIITWPVPKTVRLLRICQSGNRDRR